MARVKFEAHLYAPIGIYEFGPESHIIAHKDGELVITEGWPKSEILTNLIIKGEISINDVPCFLDREESQTNGHLVFVAHARDGSLREINRLKDMNWEFFPEALAFWKLPREPEKK